jgi:spore germination protein GerM
LKKDKESAVKRSSRKKKTEKESSKNKVVVNLFGTKNAPKAVQPIKSESSEIESEENAECLYCRGTSSKNSQF